MDWKLRTNLCHNPGCACNGGIHGILRIVVEGAADFLSLFRNYDSVFSLANTFVTLFNSLGLPLPSVKLNGTQTAAKRPSKLRLTTNGHEVRFFVSGYLGNYVS